MSVFIEVDKDNRTGLIQVSIGDNSTGYRLAGPKYSGNSVSLHRQEMSQRDATEIRQLLDAAFPITKGTK